MDGIEKGAASFLVNLSDGVITVTHGTDGVVLASLENAPDGTWDAIWCALEKLGIHNVYSRKAA